MLNSNLIWKATVLFYSGIVLSSGIKLGKNSILKIPIKVPNEEEELYLTNLADKMLKSKEELSKLNKLLELAINDKNYEMQLELEGKIED